MQKFISYLLFIFYSLFIFSLVSCINKPYTIPEKVLIIKSENINSTCYDYAAQELARLLERIGTSSVISTTSGKTDSYLLRVVSSSSELTEPVIDISHIFADGFTLEVKESGITIGAKKAKGILNGVYELAEKLGFLFLYPGENGEWPPLESNAKRSIATGKYNFNPRFKYRGIFGGSPTNEWVEYYAKLKMNALCNFLDKDMSKKLGLRMERGGHGLRMLFSKDLYKEHPEYFRMSQPEDFYGKRVDDYNFCVTSPGMKAIIQKNYRGKIKSYVDKNVYAWHTWPEDLPGGGWCHCTTCRSFSPSDQVMLAMKMLAEVIREDKLPMRVPVLAYHDTMLPGREFNPPKESFLLFAPRERCYAHALDEPTCSINKIHLQALNEWIKKFKGVDDAHTFEYYLDRVLFRGLYPTLLQVILDDMPIYQKAGIESHMTLQVGTAYVPELMMHNLPLFAQGMWNDKLTAKIYIKDISHKILPAQWKIWEDYFSGREQVFSKVMKWCDHDMQAGIDYRWIPETTLDYGREMVQIYKWGAERLTQIANQLENALSSQWPDRVKKLAQKEIARTRFESSELMSMMSQQSAANYIGEFLNSDTERSLQSGVEQLNQTLENLDQALIMARAAGIKDGDYYYTYQGWITKEIKQKIAKWAK